MFRRLESGHLEHLHYGGLLFPNKNDCLNHLDEVAEAVAPKHFNGAGNLNNYSDEHRSVMLEQLTLEMSSFGKGDIKIYFIKIPEVIMMLIKDKKEVNIDSNYFGYKTEKYKNKNGKY